MTNDSILWQCLDWPGHEAARLVDLHPGWQLAGAAVFAHDGRPCRLDYGIVCSPAWATQLAWVSGWVGEQTIEIELAADSAHGWRLNGLEQPAVAGCIDLDLNFSPSTNLLPIRRLGLEIGQAADVKAAWLRFPSFQLEPLVQQYRRLDAATYRYQSAGGAFVADLVVTETGFARLYPGLWQAEA